MSNAPLTHKPARSRPGLGVLLTVIACAAVIIAGGAAYWYLVSNPTQTPRRTPEKTARLVEIIRAEVGNYPTMLIAQGEAVPATMVQLRPDLSGRVIWIAPGLVPGGRFEAGAEIMRIEPSDFELMLTQRKSEVLQAQSQIIAAQAMLTTAQRELAIERGSQGIARREFELLGESIPESAQALVLRTPQLQAAEASVESATAAIGSAQAALAAAESRRDQAAVDLERTSLRAPFNAVVMAKSADVGDMVGVTTSVAQLLGTDRAWVELAVPLSDTRWIQVAGSDAGMPGSRVEIRSTAAWGADMFREARVIQVLPQVEADSRMARVLVEVTDPLALADNSAAVPPLLVGSYVEARVIGSMMKDVIRLPRAVVWDGDTVRVMNDADELELRRVTIAFREPEHMLISGGLETGDRIVTTNLSTAVAGLPLRVVEAAPEAEASR